MEVNEEESLLKHTFSTLRRERGEGGSASPVSFRVDEDPSPNSNSNIGSSSNSIPIPPPPPPDDYFKPKHMGYTKTTAGRKTLKLVRRTFWSLFLWHLPLVQIPLLPLLILISGLVGLGFTFQYVKVLKASVFLGVALSKLFFYSAGSITLLLLLTLALSLILLVFQAMYFGTRLYYYIDFTSVPLPFLIWSFINIVLLTGDRAIFSSMDASAKSRLINTFISVFVVSLTYIPMRIFTKYMILKYHQTKQFWEEINTYIMTERVIYRLAYSPPTSNAKQKTIHTFNLQDSDGAESLSGSGLGSSSTTTLEASWSNKVKQKIKDPLPLQFSKAWDFLLDQKHYVDSLNQPSVTVDPLDPDDRNLIPHFNNSVKDNKLSKAQAQHLSDIIFRRLDTTNKGFLTATDIAPFTNPNDFRLFDPLSSGSITRPQLFRIIKSLYFDRKRLYDTLFDRESMSSILTWVIGLIWFFIMLITVLYIYGVDLHQAVLPFGTVFLGWSFIFGNSLRRTWEGFLEIFVVRPFDVGDKLHIKDYGIVRVSSISLLATQCHAIDGRCYIIPNEWFFNNIVCSLKRSRDYCVNVNIKLIEEVDEGRIKDVKSRVKKWLEEDREKNGTPWKCGENEDWVLGVSVEESKRMVVSVWIDLEGINWESPRKYLPPQSRLCMKLHEILETPKTLEGSGSSLGGSVGAEVDGRGKMLRSGKF